MEKRYTVPEVAEIYHIDIQTVRAWIKYGLLTAMKLGKSYYIKESDILKFEEKMTTNKK